MAKQDILSKEEIRFLKELIKNQVQFMIVGLSAATLQGAPVVTQDVDLWFKDLEDPGFAKALKKVGGSYIPPMMLNPPTLVGKAVNMFDIVLHMSGLKDFDQEILNTVEVKIDRTKVKVLALERIIKSKQAANRKKDQLVLPVLKDTLLVLKEKKSK